LDGQPRGADPRGVYAVCRSKQASKHASLGKEKKGVRVTVGTTKALKKLVSHAKRGSGCRMPEKGRGAVQRRVRRAVEELKKKKGERRV